jgi:hypothetical protein
MLKWVEDDDFPGDWQAQWRGRTFAIAAQHPLADAASSARPTFRLVVWNRAKELLLEQYPLSDLATAQAEAERYALKLIERSQHRAARAGTCPARRSKTRK